MDARISRQQCLCGVHIMHQGLVPLQQQFANPRSTHDHICSGAIKRPDALSFTEPTANGDPITSYRVEWTTDANFGTAEIKTSLWNTQKMTPTEISR